MRRRRSHVDSTPPRLVAYVMMSLCSVIFCADLGPPPISNAMIVPKPG